MTEEISKKHTKTPITKEIIEKAKSLAEQNVPQNKISEQLGISPASVSRILSGELLLGKSAPAKKLRKDFATELSIIANISRYSPDEVFEKYVTKSYNTYLERFGENKFIDFATQKKNIQLSVDLTTVLYTLNETVPKNDSIFEDYKNCFDKDSFVENFTEIRKKYIQDVLNQISQTSEYANFKRLDGAENLSSEEILDILCQSKVSKPKQNQIKTPRMEQGITSPVEEETTTPAQEKIEVFSTITDENNPYIREKGEYVADLSRLGKEGYIKFLKGEIYNDEPLKNQALKYYKESLSTKDAISEEEAIECLKKIDQYLFLPKRDKLSIIKISDIFNYKKASLEKKILNKIIESKYMKENTAIYNDFYGKDMIITPKAKEEIKKQNDYIQILRDFEVAATQVSKKKNDPGVTDYENKYSMEIRLSGKHGGMRLYSKALCKDLNGNEVRNYIFEIFASDHKV